MVIAPLIFVTIVSGIVNVTNAGLGAIFVRSLVWFLSASVIAGLLGFAAAKLLGVGEGWHLSPDGEAPELGGKPNDPGNFIVHLVPQSFIKALAENQPMRSGSWRPFGSRCSSRSPPPAPRQPSLG